VAFTNFVIQKRDAQTKNKQTKTLNFSPHCGARYESPAKLGMVIEKVRTFLAPLKHAASDVQFRQRVTPAWRKTSKSGAK